MRTRYLLLVLCAGLLIVSGTQDVFASPPDPQDFSFSTFPASDIFGPPGSTVGWGYTITNLDTSDYLSFSNANLSADVFTDGTPLSLFDFPTIAPGATLTVSFDETSGTGLYQFTWDPSAPPGDSNSGLFLLSGAEFDTADGMKVADAPDHSTPYLVTDSATVVPEPSTLPLFALGIAVIVFLRKMSRVVA